MTIVIFKSWLIEFNKRMENEKRKVILLVDNAGGHNLEPKFETDKMLTCITAL